MSHVSGLIIWVFHIAVSLLAVIGLREMAFWEQGRLFSNWTIWILFAALILTLHYVR